MSKVAKKEITLNLNSDEECWSTLRFRKPDITRMIILLGMPHFQHPPDRHYFSK